MERYILSPCKDVYTRSTSRYVTKRLTGTKGSRCKIENFMHRLVTSASIVMVHVSCKRYWWNWIKLEKEKEKKKRKKYVTSKLLAKNYNRIVSDWAQAMRKCSTSSSSQNQQILTMSSQYYVRCKKRLPFIGNIVDTTEGNRSFGSFLDETKRNWE